MEIQLTDFIDRLFENREGTQDDKTRLAGMLMLIPAQVKSSPVRIRVKREQDYVQLVIPGAIPNDITSVIDLFSEVYEFSYIMDKDRLLLNFYKVHGLEDVSTLVVDTAQSTVYALNIMGKLLDELQSGKKIYNQLEEFYSSMERFMFMVEGLKSYRLLDVENFLSENLCHIADLEKFAIYISDLSDADHLKLIAYSPKDVGSDLTKSIHVAELEKITDYFIVEMETQHIKGYLLYRPKAYAHIEEDFLYLVNYILSKSIENAVLFEEKKFLAEKDALTGVYNRRYFFEALDHAVYNAKRYGRKMGLVMFDIDDFKHINDTYGHMVGDKVLKAIGSVMNRMKRQTDVAGRYGGEEFVLLCNGVNIEECVVVGERVRQEIEKLKFEGLDDLRVTVSVGGASFDAVKDMDGNVIDNLIQWADKALYKAKSLGKNRVVVCEKLLGRDKPKNTQ